MTAARQPESNSASQVEATILTFPFTSDVDAFDRENRDTMIRWKFQAKRAGYFFQADQETGDWVLVTRARAQWVAIKHLAAGREPIFRVFCRHGRWHLSAPSGEGGRQFPTLYAALQAVHRTKS